MAAEGSHIAGRFNTILEYIGRLLTKRFGYFRVYTLLFAIAIAGVCAPMIVVQKSFIWVYDGLEQTFVWFVYAGDWWRSVFASIFIDHAPALPMYTMNLGYGSDAIIPLSTTLFDPFSWISIITPPRWQQFAYDAMVIARIYCAGLAFSAFAFYWEKRKSIVLFGAFVYVFSGFAFICFKQPFLINPMIYFPLILLGLEYIFDQKSPLLFVLTVFWAFLSQFFTAYVVALFVIAYAFVRYRQRNGRFLSKRFVLCFLRVAGFFILGVGLSAFILLPTLFSMLGMERLSVERSWAVFYPWLSYYYTLIAGFLSPNELVADTFFGFTPPVFILTVVLFLRRKQHKTLFITFIVLMLCFVFSFSGRVLNAFQYPANRWSFVFALFMAFVAIKLFSELRTLTKKEKTSILVSCCVYGVVVYLLPNSHNYAGMGFHVSFIILMLIVFMLFSDRVRSTRMISVFLTISVIISGIVNWGGEMLPYVGANRQSMQVAFGSAMDMQTTGTTAYPLSLFDDRTDWRVDAVQGGYPQNSGLIQKLNTVSFYNSLYNGWIDSYHTELGLTTTTSLNFRYDTLAKRSALLALSGVKYYCAWDSSTEKDIPYIFSGVHGTELPTAPQDWRRIIKTDLSLPLAFVYSSAIPTEVYENLSMTEKQEALLQGVVCDGLNLPTTRLQLSKEARQLSVVPVRRDGLGAYTTQDADDAIRFEDNTVTVLQGGAGLRISFEGRKDVETYLLLEGLTYGPLPPSGIRERLMASAPGTHEFSALYNDSSAYLMTFSQYGGLAHMYSGKSDFALHLGYSSEAANEIILVFWTPGVYQLSDIKVAMLPMEEMTQQITALQDDAPRQASFAPGEVTVTTDYASQRALFFSIPYSVGWKAMIDGVEAEVHRANTAFMAIDLPAGRHEVVLYYRTPLLFEGLMISLGSALMLVLVLVYRRAKTVTARRKHEASQD